MSDKFDIKAKRDKKNDHHKGNPYEYTPPPNMKSKEIGTNSTRKQTPVRIHFGDQHNIGHYSLVTGKRTKAKLGDN